MIIRPGSSSDLDLASNWLEDAELPVADLTEAHMNDFLFALVDERPVGMIGIEQYDHIALLRSLVVARSARSGGVGRSLVSALEKLARSRRVTELWLLTIDADRYFESLGYATRSRDTAPDDIRNTVEFSRLCPGDAVLMQKRL